MNMEQTLKIRGMTAAVAGTQATTPDSPAADKWIKDWMDRRQGTLNDIRQQLTRTFDPEVSHKDDGPDLDANAMQDDDCSTDTETDSTDCTDDDDDVEAAKYIGKPSPGQQMPWKAAGGGRWAVTDPNGLIYSTHPDREEAATAASAKRYAKVIDLNAEPEYRKKYLVPRSDLLKSVDFLRKGIMLPSKEYLRRTGAAGGGGAAGPSGGNG